MFPIESDKLESVYPSEYIEYERLCREFCIKNQNCLGYYYNEKTKLCFTLPSSN